MLSRVCSLLVAGVVTATIANSATGSDCCNPCAPVTTRKVSVVQYVPEQVPVTRTTYKTVCRDEVYTAYRTEYAQETRTCNRTVLKPITETVLETRTVCEKVPVTEQKTCFKTVVTKVPVTETKLVSVDRGHFECCEVPAKPSLLDRLCHKKDDCCPKMVTKKVWVPNIVCEPRTVTTCKTVCEQVPYTVTVTRCQIVNKTIQVPVTKTRCVPEQVVDTFTVCVPKQVPFQCTRKVTSCVPVTETVLCTRMVAKCVEQEVAVAAASSCCEKSASLCSAKPARRKLCQREKAGCGSAVVASASCCH